MSKLTKDKIGKLLDSQVVGNFSSLASLSKQDLITLEKPPLAGEEALDEIKQNTSINNSINNNKTIDTYSHSCVKKEKNFFHIEHSTSKTVLNTDEIEFLEKTLATQNFFNENTSNKLAAIRNKEIFGSDQDLSITDPEKKVKKNDKVNIVNETLDTSNVLGGKGLSLVMYLIELCRQNCSLVTPPVFTKDLLQVINIKSNHLRNLIIRLKKQKVFKVLLYKSSNNAVRIFEFEKYNYDSLIKKNNQIENNISTYSISSKESSDLSEREYKNKLAHRFKDIDLSSLESIGFDETHLIQIHKEYEKNPDKELSAEILQNSINAFSFDLKHNCIKESFKSSPAVVLLSLLKKGIPYSSKTPEKVLSPTHEAMQEYLLAQEKKQQRISEIESKAKILSMQEWLDSLSEEELLEFNKEPRLEGIPEKVYQASRRRKAVEFAKDYFNTVIWYKKRKEIFDEMKI